MLNKYEILDFKKRFIVKRWTWILSYVFNLLRQNKYTKYKIYTANWKSHFGKSQGLLHSYNMYTSTQPIVNATAISKRNSCTTMYMHERFIWKQRLQNSRFNNRLNNAKTAILDCISVNVGAQPTTLVIRRDNPSVISQAFDPESRPTGNLLFWQ